MGRILRGRVRTITRKGPTLEPGRAVQVGGVWGVCLTYYDGQAWAWLPEKPAAPVGFDQFSPSGYLVRILAATPVQVRGQDLPETAIHPDGYTKVRLGVGHPLADRSGWGFAHRLVLAAVLRRKPGREDVTEFLDGNSRNLSLSNVSRKTWQRHQDRFLRRDQAVTRTEPGTAEVGPPVASP